jgi:DNA-directed RNA polymerase subunit RPC12/RpoP
LKEPEKSIADSEKSKEERKYFCLVCGREISEEEYENYDEMCWECWDDQLTEESDTMFGDLM